MIRATGLVATITRANGEQATGLGEINAAVAQMEDVTQHNAARVEEVAAAARLRDGLSDTMNEQIARFRLADQTGPASAALIMRTS